MQVNRAGDFSSPRTSILFWVRFSIRLTLERILWRNVYLSHWPAGFPEITPLKCLKRKKDRKAAGFLQAFHWARRFKGLAPGSQEKMGKVEI
jgi:hypothetical protein